MWEKFVKNLVTCAKWHLFVSYKSGCLITQFLRVLSEFIYINASVRQISHSPFHLKKKENQINKCSLSQAERFEKCCWVTPLDWGSSRTSSPRRAVWPHIGRHLYWQRAGYDRCSSCCTQAVGWRTAALQKIRCSSSTKDLSIPLICRYIRYIYRLILPNDCMF